MLKLQPPGLAPRTTKVLRAVGYPAPRYVVVADAYSVQEELPGVPLGEWDVAPPAGLIELNELQEGRAVDGDRTWADAVVESVEVGFDEYMVLRSLEEHSSEGRELLRLCRRAVERHSRRLTARDDIVHWDFTAANILVDRGDVSGVIDWGGTCSGDRLFDLATFAFYAPATGAGLRAYVVERIGEEGLCVYLAHMAIRQADWSVRRHRDEVGWAMVRYGLELARGFPL
ncbi:MAG TPA: phosphotransferase [Gaiellaceae bacterium]|nr:phosphotransferase [Gaiellaceae bacterium]